MDKIIDSTTIQIDDMGKLRNITFNLIDLGENKLKAMKIALIQVSGPEYNIGWKKREISYFNRENDLLKFLDENFRMRRNIVDEQKEKIMKLVNFAIEDKANIICLPNMVIPDDMDCTFKKESKENQIVLISGFEYIKDEEENLRNIINLYFPKNRECLKFTYNKIFKSKFDPEIKVGDVINIYTNTGFGTFTILNCFDYTNISLLSEINRYKVDIIFVTSHNPAYRIFRNYCLADSHRYYSYIAIVNSGDFGGTAIYAPIRKEGFYFIHNYLRGLDGKGDGIITQDIDVRDLIFSRTKTIPGWMNPPDIDENEKNIDLLTIDFKQDIKNKCFISLVELEAPDEKDYVKNNWKFTDSYRKKIKYEIVKILEKLKYEKTNFIIFPEVSLPEGIEKILYEFSKENGVYIIGGFEYNDKIQNRCKIFTPHTPDKTDFSKYQDNLYYSKLWRQNEVGFLGQ